MSVNHHSLIDKQDGSIPRYIPNRCFTNRDIPVCRATLRSIYLQCLQK